MGRRGGSLSINPPRALYGLQGAAAYEEGGGRRQGYIPREGGAEVPVRELTAVVGGGVTGFAEAAAALVAAVAAGGAAFLAGVGEVGGVLLSECW